MTSTPWRWLYDGDFMTLTSWRWLHDVNFKTSTSWRGLHDDDFITLTSWRRLHDDVFMTLTSWRRLHDDDFMTLTSLTVTFHLLVWLTSNIRKNGLVSIPDLKPLIDWFLFVVSDDNQSQCRQYSFWMCLRIAIYNLDGRHAWNSRSTRSVLSR